MSFVSRAGEVLPETTEQYPTEDGEEEDEEQEYIVDEWYDGDLRAILVLDEITEYFDEVCSFINRDIEKWISLLNWIVFSLRFWFWKIPVIWNTLNTSYCISTYYFFSFNLPRGFLFR